MKNNDNVITDAKIDVNPCNFGKWYTVILIVRVIQYIISVADNDTLRRMTSMPDISFILAEIICAVVLSFICLYLNRYSEKYGYASIFFTASVFLKVMGKSLLFCEKDVLSDIFVIISALFGMTAVIFLFGGHMETLRSHSRQLADQWDTMRKISILVLFGTNCRLSILKGIVKLFAGVITAILYMIFCASEIILIFDTAKHFTRAKFKA